MHKHMVRVPSGHCPIKFQMFWDLASQGCQPPDTIVAAWFWEVREYGLRRGEFLTVNAIAYWANFELNEFSEDIRRDIVRTIYEYAWEIGDPDATDPKTLY